MDGLENARILSLFLVNRRTPRDHDRDLAFAFQVGFTLRYARGFQPRPNRRGEGADDDDQRVLALLFRDRAEWAVGHNTSVQAPVPDPDGTVRTLATTQLPRYEVPLVEHQPVPALVTEMDKLGGFDGAGLERALWPLIDEYRAWTDEQRYCHLPRTSLAHTRDALMDKADRARERMEAGIRLLQQDARVREAFQLANQAMHAAAMQADKRREDRRYGGGRRPAWRPFQLAFVLMNLAAVADPL